MKRYVYAIDVGGSSIKFGLFTTEGQFLRSWKVRTPRSKDAHGLCAVVAKTIKKQQESVSEILGFGIGVPGPVVEDTVFSAVNLGWGEVNVKTLFQSFFEEDVIIKVENDANIAALGESMHGAGTAYKDMALFTLGTGIGGGIVHRGKVLSGAHGVGGEFGHLTIDLHDFTCGCGRKRCLETVASATGVKNLLRYYFKRGEITTALTSTNISAKQLVEYAKAGDAMCLKIVDDMTFALAKAAAQIGVISNPDVFVFGGGISQAGDFIIDKIEAHFQTMAFKPLKATRFVRSVLGNQAALYGAYAMVMADV